MSIEKIKARITLAYSELSAISINQLKAEG
jgi:hypothetical protein